MLRIVEEASHFQPDGSRGVVVVESDAATAAPFHASFDELTSPDAIAKAQAYAIAQGCSPAMLNGNKSSPYPVNADGKSLEQVTDEKGNSLPQTHPKMQPARYRIDIPLARGMR